MDLEARLSERLRGALPANSCFNVHHISAPPIPCPPLFSAPPSQKPEPTECESHFLSVSILHDGQLVQVFALEVLVYITSTLTTIFVSKADSTGYLYLSHLPRGTPSPIKTITSQFLEHLIEIKRKNDTRLVLSLFARAQNQYLFPGSIENTYKHVLDDRQLINWWCKIFDSILQKYTTSPSINLAPNGKSSHTARAYLVVPGSDAYETRAFFPRQPTSSPPQIPLRWVAGDPLKSLGKVSTLPERCLIPRFPDDPKARFALDLDDELPENGPQPQDSPAKNPHPGRWRSVRTLEQFWELMAFRQECAAGRLVGFLWGVFEPVGLFGKPFEAHTETELEEGKDAAFVTSNGVTADGIRGKALEQPLRLLPPPIELKSDTYASPLDFQVMPNTTDGEKGASSVPDSLPSTDVSAEPTDPGHVLSLQTPSAALQPSSSLILPTTAYAEITDLLLTLDYADTALATDSTKQFLSAAGAAAGLTTNTGSDRVCSWGFEVVGGMKEIRPPENGALGRQGGMDASAKAGHVLESKAEGSSVQSCQQTVPSEHGVALLGAGLVRKKNKKRDVEEAALEGGTGGNTDAALKPPPLDDGGMMDKQRAQAKEMERTDGRAIREQEEEEGVPNVKVLSAGLVRKKAKVQALQD